MKLNKKLIKTPSSESVFFFFLFLKNLNFMPLKIPSDTFIKDLRLRTLLSKLKHCLKNSASKYHTNTLNCYRFDYSEYLKHKMISLIRIKYEQLIATESSVKYFKKCIY